MRILLVWLINALALIAVAYLVPSIHVSSFTSALVAALVLGSRKDYGFVAHAFASRGFVVVLPDYRKSPPVPIPGFVQDGAAAVASLADGVGGESFTARTMRKGTPPRAAAIR